MVQNSNLWNRRQLATFRDILGGLGYTGISLDPGEWLCGPGAGAPSDSGGSVSKSAAGCGSCIDNGLNLSSFVDREASSRDGRSVREKSLSSSLSSASSSSSPTSPEEPFKIGEVAQTHYSRPVVFVSTIPSQGGGPLPV